MNELRVERVLTNGLLGSEPSVAVDGAAGKPGPPQGDVEVNAGQEPAAVFGCGDGVVMGFLSLLQGCWVDHSRPE